MAGASKNPASDIHVLGRYERSVRTMDFAIEAAWTPMLAAFLASLVEFVEALTVVLAVGTVRGWRPALTGTALALAVLLGLVVILGPTLTHIPLGLVQFVVGTLLVLFGMRWLRKAILRAAGIIALHDEEAAFANEMQNMQRYRNYSAGLDRVAVAAAFKIVMLEGIEVVFIVIAIGAAGQMLLPASVGALAALAVVILFGVLVHRPLARVPENTLKFAVGVLLSAFGTFWAGEGIGVVWPGGDTALLVLIAVFLVMALLLVPVARARRARIA
jgi:Ca2+/H+ antiporter, TMEM165/GDT1 family